MNLPLYYYLVYVFLLAGVVFSVSAKKLTVPAALLGGVTGLFVFMGGGITGLFMLILFFILGTVATGLGLKRKQAIGIADADSSRRNAGQVFANGGIAAVSGVIAWLKPGYAHVSELMMAGSLAAATADTLSSELGTLFGRNFYNVITFKSDIRGLNGVISMEGTLTGIMGALIMAVIYSIGYSRGSEPIWIMIAGTIGNLTDSLLGATLERRNFIGNNAVNFLNTLTGAVICLLFWVVYR